MKDLVYEYGKDILTSENFLRETAFRHHGAKSCFCHSVCVAYESVRLALKSKKKIDMRSLVRGALLHDYYLYDWHEKDDSHKWHGFSHAHTALLNADARFALTDKERDIIAHHMWPLNLTKLPRCREALLVCLVDKYCSTVETLTMRSAESAF